MGSVIKLDAASRIFNEKLPEIDTYLTYAEERKNSKRIAVFREFIVEKGKEWKF